MARITDGVDASTAIADGTSEPSDFMARILAAGDLVLGGAAAYNRCVWEEVR